MSDNLTTFDRASRGLPPRVAPGPMSVSQIRAMQLHKSERERAERRRKAQEVVQLEQAEQIGGDE